jgi:hypothetical protein
MEVTFVCFCVFEVWWWFAQNTMKQNSTTARVHL